MITFLNIIARSFIIAVINGIFLMLPSSIDMGADFFRSGSIGILMAILMIASLHTLPYGILWYLLFRKDPIKKIFYIFLPISVIFPLVCVLCFDWAAFYALQLGWVLILPLTKVILVLKKEYIDSKAETESSAPCK